MEPEGQSIPVPVQLSGWIVLRQGLLHALQRVVDLAGSLFGLALSFCQGGQHGTRIAAKIADLLRQLSVL